MTVAGARVYLFGLPLDPVVMEQAVDLCLGWCASGVATRSVVPINAAVVVAARSDAELRAACERADLCLADGASIVWAARLAGEHIPERVPGIDLMQRLLACAERDGLAVYFLGARPETLDRLIGVCAQKFPRLRIAGSQDGYFDRSEESAVAAKVRASGAQILFVGMPSPYKEVWTERYRNALDVPVVLNVGGSFDVVAGIIPRSPRWLQKIGMEWSWRLLCEPRRLWKRYLFTNSYFIGLTFEMAARRLALSLLKALRRHDAG